MLNRSNILINGLKELNAIEKGTYNNKYRKEPIRLPQIKFNSDILLFLEKYDKYTNHDDFQDHDDMESEFDDLIILASDDIFDKNEINIISSRNLIINSFPNALLLEESVTDKKDQITISPKINDNIIKKEETIWDIIDKIKEENDSDILDLLTTESDVQSDTNDGLNDCTNSILEKVCKGCNNKGTLIEDQRTSVIVCSDCGMINEELFDYGPEWHQYNNDDNRGDGVSRCGCPSNYFFPKSSQGTIMIGIGSNRLKRKQKWNSMVYKERSLNIVFEYISEYCSKKNIPRIIIDSAKILYKRLSDCKHKSGATAGKQIIIRGENRLSVIATCVFKACELNKSPRNVREIAEIFGLDDKKITKGIKKFNQIMKNADDNDIIMNQFDTNTAEDYIRRHCPKLRINKQNTDLAVKIAQNCCKMKLASDHNPPSIAAGAILVMVQYLNLDVEKKNIAKLFGTSDVTIGKIYNKVAMYVDALVDDEATEYLINKFKING